MNPADLLQYGTHHGMGWGWGWAGWFGLLQVLLFALLLAAVVVVFVRFGGAQFSESGGGLTDTRTRDPALGTLRERYASGEIDEEEFERRRRVLEPVDRDG